MRRHAEQERMPVYVIRLYRREKLDEGRCQVSKLFCMCTTRRWVSMWATVCKQSWGKKLKKQVCITTLPPHGHVTYKNTPGNKMLYMESSAEESKLESSWVRQWSAAVRPPLPILHFLSAEVAISWLRRTFFFFYHFTPPPLCNNFPPSVSCSAVAGLTGRQDDDDVSELTPVHSISAWSISKRMSFSKAELRGAQPPRGVSFA